MRRTILGLGVMLAGVALTTAQPVWGCGYGMPSPLARFAQADCAVVGKVTIVEEKTVFALPVAKAPQKLEYHVAVVQVVEGLKGDGGVTHLRIGFLEPMVLQPGLEACFYLTEHFQESFYHMGSNYEYPIIKENNPGFWLQVNQLRRMSQVLKDPKASLQAKDAEDRFLTAALLITQYRTVPTDGGAATTKPIDAQQSKLILEALAEADWSKRLLDFRVTGWTLFAQLGVTPADGWSPAGFTDHKVMETAARKWLKDHAETFRIKAYVQG